ncbi:MAG: TonB-dependent receptor [Candidatus Acidiferrales bacterium]
MRDSSGAFVSGARVELHAKSYSANATTDASGQFVFENVPEPSGSVVITASGFRQETRAWTFAAGQSAPLDVTVEPATVTQSVVVTAARTAINLSDSPSSDVQLDRGNLLSTPALALPDQLKQVPGFSLFRRSSSRTANPTTQGVSLRGLGTSGTSRALVLEDGIPLNDPFGGWVYWDRVPNESISSVEIVQEGASSLYGSDALGGVVQFLTRPASPEGISLETSYGNQNSPDLSVWAGGEKGRWESTVGGGVFHTDGYILTPEADRGSVDTKAGVSDSIADLMVGRKIGVQSEIFARGWYFDESRNNGTVLQTNDTRLGQGAFGADLQLGAAGSLTLRFYGDAQTYHQSFSAVAQGRNSESLTDLQTVPAQSVGGSAVWSRSAGKRQTLVAGFDEQEVIGVSQDALFSGGAPSRDIFAGGRQQTAGIFGEDLIQLGPRWLLTASARFDDWRNFDSSSLRNPIEPPGPSANTPFPNRSQNAFSPRLGLQHQWNSHISSSASVYRAFRAPTLNEMYRQFRQGNVLTQANANLNAERLTGGEAGVSMNALQNKVIVRGTFFLNEIIDPVANVTLNVTPTLITRQRQNLGRTRAPGFEIDATTRITDRFELAGGYEYVDATVDSFPAETSLVGLWVAQVPHNVLTFRARYTNPSRLSFSVDGRMIGKQFDDDQNQFQLGRFFTLDAMASRTLGHGVELFGAAENLLNAKYATAATPVLQLGLPITARFGFRFDFPSH